MLYRLNDFNVGDVVRVKEWDEMIRDGCIVFSPNNDDQDVALFPPGFTGGAPFVDCMRSMCGGKYVITGIDRDPEHSCGLINCTELDLDTEKPSGFIDAYMLEPTGKTYSIAQGDEEFEESDEIDTFLYEWGPLCRER